MAHLMITDEEGQKWYVHESDTAYQFILDVSRKLGVKPIYAVPPARVIIEGAVSENDRQSVITRLQRAADIYDRSHDQDIKELLVRELKALQFVRAAGEVI